MKFYYNGKLVRTSKNHEYKYAVMLGEKCYGCSATLKGAQSTYNSTAKNWRENKSFYERVLHGTYKRQYKWQTSLAEIKAQYTDEQLVEFIGGYDKMLDALQIVELEARV